MAGVHLLAFACWVAPCLEDEGLVDHRGSHLGTQAEAFDAYLDLGEDRSYQEGR
jgi:hypothetical protein